MKLTPEYEAMVRSAINPAYSSQRGTESYERSALLEEIDRLRAGIQKWIDARNAPITGLFGVAEMEALKVAEDELENCMSRKCWKCGAEMKEGVAIAQTFTGMTDFIGDEDCVTISPGGSGNLVECVKCPECGWSVTK